MFLVSSKFSSGGHSSTGWACDGIKELCKFLLSLLMMDRLAGFIQSYLRAWKLWFQCCTEWHRKLLSSKISGRFVRRQDSLTCFCIPFSLSRNLADLSYFLYTFITFRLTPMSQSGCSMKFIIIEGTLCNQIKLKISDRNKFLARWQKSALFFPSPPSLSPTASSH